MSAAELTAVVVEVGADPLDLLPDAATSDHRAVAAVMLHNHLADGLVPFTARQLAGRVRLSYSYTSALLLALERWGWCSGRRRAGAATVWRLRVRWGLSGPRPAPTSSYPQPSSGEETLTRVVRSGTTPDPSHPWKQRPRRRAEQLAAVRTARPKAPPPVDDLPFALRVDPADPGYLIPVNPPHACCSCWECQACLDSMVRHPDA